PVASSTFPALAYPCTAADTSVRWISNWSVPGHVSAFGQGILVLSLSILYIEWSRVKSPTLGRIVYVARRPYRCRWLAASEERTFGLILFDAVTFREGHQITWFPG